MSGNNTFVQLDYLILHMCDTLVFHAFEFTHKDTPYVLPIILEVLLGNSVKIEISSYL